MLDSFKVISGKKILDYRLGERLNLHKIKLFFQRSYTVKKIWNGGRHVLGILTKNNKTYFLKLSTSEGISIVTKTEQAWNDYFNNHFSNTIYRVPKNHYSGFYQDKYFYLITDYFKGKLLCEMRYAYTNADKLIVFIPQIIEFFNLIQGLPGTDGNYKVRFINKTKAWFGDIPVDIRNKFGVKILLSIVEKGIGALLSRVRHGDFTPWHLIKLPDKKIGLIDGEHFLTNGVEGYDICYFIQRVFSVLKNPPVAKKYILNYCLMDHKKRNCKQCWQPGQLEDFWMNHW